MPLFLLAFYYSPAQVHTPKYISMAAASGGYYEYLPQGYSSSTSSYPLILFIHGLGDLGNGSSQLQNVLRNGLAKRINEGGFPSSFTVNGVTSRFVVITPQFNRWPRTTDVDEVLNYIVSHYRIDRSRIYITGLSMGGGATWEYVGTTTNLNNIQRTAAIVPIAGASTPTTTRARNIAKYNLPVWAFHNSDDPDVSVSNTTTYVERINQAPAPVPAARMTIFNASGHDAWTRAYDPAYRENGKNIYEWMLQYSRGGTPPPADNVAPTANAGSDKSITLPTSSVALSGAGTDQNGTIAGYTWSKTAGPAQYSFSSTTVSNPTVSQLTAGTYTFRLTVRDNQGATDYDDVNVVVSSAPVTNHPVPGRIQAESYSQMQGIQTETSSDADGSLNVGWVESGDWMDYNLAVSSAGSYLVNFRVATTASNNQIQLRKTDGTVLTTTVLPNTGGWQTWTTVSTTLSLAAGNQTIRIYAPTGGFNLNWFEFTPNSGTPPATTRYVKVNLYGGTNPYTNSEWNNWAVSTYSGNLKYSNGTASAISATFNTAGEVSDNGSSYPGGIAPAQVLRYTNYSSPNRTLTISGLDPGKTYSLELYASRAINAGNSTIFKLGTATQTLETYRNSTQSAKFFNHRPDANGRLIITISKSGSYNYLNGFVLTENGSATTQASRSTAPETYATSSAENDSLTERKVLYKEEIRFYPNPFRSQIFLEINNQETGTMQIIISDLAGRIHRQYQLNKPQETFNDILQTGELPEGMYFMRIQIGKWTTTRKILHTAK